MVRTRGAGRILPPRARLLVTRGTQLPKSPVAWLPNACHQTPGREPGRRSPLSRRPTAEAVRWFYPTRCIASALAMVQTRATKLASFSARWPGSPKSPSGEGRDFAQPDQPSHAPRRPRADDSRLTAHVATARPVDRPQDRYPGHLFVTQRGRNHPETVARRRCGKARPPLSRSRLGRTGWLTPDRHEGSFHRPSANRVAPIETWPEMSSATAPRRLASGRGS